MDKIFNILSIAAGIIGGITASLLGAWDTILWALIILMLLDYITGIIKAIYMKTLSSDIGFRGLLRKISILVIVVLSNVLQVLIGGNAAVREMVIMFYIANEGISILENTAAILPNMPESLKNVLLQLRGDDNADN